MTYSLSDIYPNMMGNQIATTSQTIPEGEENEKYAEATADNVQGMKTVVNKNMIWGALLLFVGLLVALHFID